MSSQLSLGIRDFRVVGTEIVEKFTAHSTHEDMKILNIKGT